MTLIDVRWTTYVNLLTVQCDCRVIFEWPSNVSVVGCPLCGRRELWHSVDPRPEKGPWSLRVMKHKLAPCRQVEPPHNSLS